MENQLTPVQWLEQEFWKPEVINNVRLGGFKLMEELFAKAKEMEISKHDEPINHKEIADHIFNELNKID